MDVVYAVTNQSVNSPRGFPVMVRAGSHWPTTDPIVRDNPWLFSDDPRTGITYSEPPPEVEQASAAPGERRPARRR